MRASVKSMSMVASLRYVSITGLTYARIILCALAGLAPRLMSKLMVYPLPRGVQIRVAHRSRSFRGPDSSRPRFSKWASQGRWFRRLSLLVSSHARFLCALHCTRTLRSFLRTLSTSSSSEVRCWSCFQSVHSSRCDRWRGRKCDCNSAVRESTNVCVGY